MYMLTVAGDSLLLWWQCNRPCTSGFVDDVMFSHNGANGAESHTTLCFVEFAKWRHRGRSCFLRLPCW